MKIVKQSAASESGSESPNKKRTREPDLWNPDSLTAARTLCLFHLLLDLSPQPNMQSFMHSDDPDDSHIDMSYVFPAAVTNFHSSVPQMFARDGWWGSGCTDQPQNAPRLSRPQAGRTNTGPEPQREARARATEADGRPRGAGRHAIQSQRPGFKSQLCCCQPRDPGRVPDDFLGAQNPHPQGETRFLWEV